VNALTFAVSMGMERIEANQVWKTVGFAPGMLAKE